MANISQREMGYGDRGYGGVNMVPFNSGPYFQGPEVVVASQPARIIKSCPLIGFGIFLLLLSGASVGLSSWLMNLSNNDAFSSSTLACSLFFLIISFLSIYGGIDVENRKCVLICCLVFGFLSVGFSLSPMITSVVAIGYYKSDCFRCYNNYPFIGNNESLKASICGSMCSSQYTAANVAIVALAGFESLVALILSIVASYYTCSCCACCYQNARARGHVVQPPTAPPSYPPPPYGQMPYTPAQPVYNIPYQTANHYQK